MQHYKNEDATAILHESAFKNKCCVYRLTTHKIFHSITKFMEVISPILCEIASMVKKDHANGMMGYIQLCIQMIDEDYNNVTNTRKDVFYFSTKMTYIYNMDIWMKHSIESLNNKMDKFCEKSSGWVIDHIKFAEFRFIKL